MNKLENTIRNQYQVEETFYFSIQESGEQWNIKEKYLDYIRANFS